MGRRGIIPSLGAGTSLIVAGVLCLAVISSLIAFRGFPGLGPDAARPPVRLATPAADRTGRSAPAPIVSIVVGATAGSATLTVPVRRPGARGSARTHTDGRAVRIRNTPSAGSSPEAPVSDPVTVPPEATPSADQPDSGTDTPVSASRPGPVRQTLDRVRDAVAPVQPPPAPPAVQPVVDQATQVVNTANDAVDQAAGAADDLVGSVLR